MPKIVTQVYETNNYSLFNKLENNRDVLDARLRKLIASFSKKQIMNPIIVNERMEIIDGQGRFEALKLLKMPVQYIIAPGTDINDCHILNMYNTNWSMLDYAKSYATNNQNYANLLLACEKTGYTIPAVLRLANHSTARGYRGTDGSNAVKDGRVIFTESDVVESIKVKKIIDDIYSALAASFRTNDAFKHAIKVMADNPEYDHQRMIENCKKCRSSFVQTAGLENQLKEFDRIYNYKRKPDARVYFSDYMRNKGYNSRDYGKTTTEYSDKNVQTLGGN